MDELTLETSPMHVKNVGMYFIASVSFKDMKGLTSEKSWMNVKNVIKPFILLVLLQTMKKLTLKKNSDTQNMGNLSLPVF